MSLPLIPLPFYREAFLLHYRCYKPDIRAEEDFMSAQQQVHSCTSSNSLVSITRKPKVHRQKKKWMIEIDRRVS